MRSRALDRLRSAQHTRTVSGEDASTFERAEAPSEDPAFGPDRRRVREVVGTLPQPQREVLELAYFGGLSSREIATRVGIPVGTVKSRTAAALARLRQALRGGAP